MKNLNSKSLNLGYRGYVVPRKFFEYSLPTSVQNLLLRDYASKNGFTYKLPPCELVFDNSYVQYKGLLADLKNVDGLLFPSIFNLPNSVQLRKKTYNLIIKNKKTIHFVIEKTKIEKKSDIDHIELIFKLNKFINNIDKLFFKKILKL